MRTKNRTAQVIKGKTVRVLRGKVVVRVTTVPRPGRRGRSTAAATFSGLRTTTATRTKAGIHRANRKASCRGINREARTSMGTKTKARQRTGTGMGAGARRDKKGSKYSNVECCFAMSCSISCELVVELEQLLCICMDLSLAPGMPEKKTAPTTSSRGRCRTGCRANSRVRSQPRPSR